MRKLSIIVSFLLSYLFADSQITFPNYQQFGAPTTLTDIKGAVKSGKGVINGLYTDTAQANTGYIKYYPGAQIFTTSNNTLWLRNSAATKWLSSSISGSISSFNFNSDSTLIICFASGICDTLYMTNRVFATHNYVDSSLMMNVNNGNCNGVLPGGNVVTWSGTGLKFYISAGNFSIQCRNYYGESDSVVLAAADPINPRFDVIYRDTSGNVGVITGVPSISPALPQINAAHQIALTYILVDAGAIVPSGITNRLIYDENLQVAGGEWNTLATNINVFPNQTPVASNLIRSTYWDHVYALGASYSNTSNISVSSQDILWFKILFKGFNSYNPTQENVIGLSLVQDGVPFIEGAGITYIKHGINGLDTNNKTGWQTIAVPLSQFLNPYQGNLYTLDSVYSLSINTINSDTVGGGAEFYIDEINLQSGLVQAGVKPGIYVNDVYSTEGAIADTLWKIRNGDTSVVNIYDRSCGISHPGVVTWDSLLVFSVSPSVYRLCCDGIRRYTNQTNVTLSAAHSTLNRFDAIVLDKNGVNVVTGTAGATPELPQILDCQILLTYIFIPAGSTTPGNGGNGCGLPGQEVIYDETGGGEWTPATVGITINFSNLTNPYHLTKAGDAGAFSAGQSFSFTKGSNITLSDYTAVKFYIRLKSAWNPNTKLGIFFQNTSSVQPSRSVILQNGLFNFVRTTVGSYQEITIPMSQFLGGTTNVVNKLYFLVLNTGNADGFYIDWIQLQAGICQPTTTANGTVTSISAGNLSPLFTTTVTNPTTTPALSFSQISQTQNKVFASPNGSAGVPSFRALVADDLPYTASNGLTLSGSDFKLGGTLTGNTNVSLAGFTFDFKQNGNSFLTIDPTAGSEFSQLKAHNITGTGNYAALQAFGSNIQPITRMESSFNNNDKYATIDVYANSTLGSVNIDAETTTFQGRMEEAKGLNVLASNDLTLGLGGNLFNISGDVQINAITTANWQAGSQIGLIFYGSPLVKNNTAGGAGTAPILLAGRVDYQASAGDYLGLRFDGTNWYETNRKLAASSGIYTASNGLTLSGSDFKLGGTLTGNTTLTGGAFGLILTGTSATVSSLDISNNSIGAGSIVNISSTSTAAASNLQKGINVSLSGANSNSSEVTYGIYSSNTHTGSGVTTNYGVYGTASGGVLNYGVYGISADYIGVSGTSTTGYGVTGGASSGIGGSFTSSSSTGLEAASTSSISAQLTVNPSSGSTVVTNIVLKRITSTSASNGIGQSIDFTTKTSTGLPVSNQLISKWADATDATRTSQFIITGVNSAVTGNIAYFNGNGMVGIGSDAASATRLNVVDDAVGAASIVNISSTSTAAASNLQKGINVNLSGANATASQTTYGGYFSNTHTGGGANYGLFVTASGGTTNYGVRGESSDYIGVYGVGGANGVYGISTSGNGIWGSSTSGYGISANSTSGVAGSFSTNPSSTNSVSSILELIRGTSGTASNGVGQSIDIYNESDNGTTRLSNKLISKWTTAADATRTSQFIITGVTSAATQDWLTIGQSGYVNFRPMTVTEAGAITAAEGMMIFVSNTDATFTSIGFWGYQNGAWVKL